MSYSGEFGGAGVELQAGLATASVPGNAEAAGFDDYFAYNGGVLISYQGFTIAGSFAFIDEGLALGCAGTVCPQSNEGQAYEVGIGYETGPWGFSASFLQGEEDAIIANAGDEENTFFTVAGSYTLGPGIRTSLSYLHGSKDADVETPGTTVSREADAVMWGVHLGF